MRTKLYLIAILFLGIVLRVWDLTSIPPGFYADEAFVGYEAFSLLHTQADEWGVRLPAYFTSSGSGQSVLYSYLSLPIIWGLGLSPFSTRLLSLLAGILTLPLLYLTVRRKYGARSGLIAMLLLALMPWHVMISRWALDANLLPFFLLLAIYAMERAVATNSTLWLCASSFFWALSLYTYALAYFIVPVFFFLYLLIERKAIFEDSGKWLIALGVFGVIALPIGLFLAKNFLVHGDIGIEPYLPFGIPLLPFSRLAHVSSPVADRLSNNLVFLINAFQDGEVRNMVIGSPPTFLILFPLALVGSYFSVQRLRRGQTDLFFLLLVSCLVLFFPADLVINRINAIFIPMLAMGVYGWSELRWLVRTLLARKILDLGVIALISVQSLVFLFDYFFVYPTSPDTEIAYFKGFDRAIRTGVGVAEPADEILVTNRIAPPYVLTAFHTSYPPENYQRQVHFTLESEAIQVKSLGRFYFGVENLPDVNAPLTYVLGKWEEPPCANPKVSLDTRLWQVGRCASH